MADFSIGLSGLNAAQKALDTIGNNIANAATEGYHRQRIEFTPAYSSQQGSTLIGGGVDVSNIRRMVDNLLEQEILRQQSASGQVSQESNTLRMVENAFGELSSEDSGLNAAIDKFFNSLQDISANPTDIIRQNQIVSDANAMAAQFRNLGEFLTIAETQIRLEAENTVDSINALTTQIAEFNQKIESVVMVGGNANTMSDQRDKCISDLSKLIGIQTVSRENGIVDIATGGIPLVIGSSSSKLESGFDANNNLGISIAGASSYITDIQGGKLGGLLSLRNDIVSDIHDDLDSIAAAIIQQINQYHVQGVGSEGSFTSLTSQTNTSEDLADFSNVTAGYTYIRVTKISDGSVVRTAIPVLQDSSSDSLTDIAGFINTSVGNVSAFVNSSNQLTISADSGYKFDFLPAVLSEPEATDINFNG
ncbi:MAG: flagellar hook-associated protein FlgK, partial [Sedimentisphaerales bacterium]